MSLLVARRRNHVYTSTMIAKVLTATALVFIYFLLSFNAYACLVPLYGGQADQYSDCSMPQEQSAKQYCDDFKSLAVQSVSSLQPQGDVIALQAAAVEFFPPVQESLSSWNLFTRGGPPPFAQDPLALTSVLRL
jgi:hypothetical protein